MLSLTPLLPDNVSRVATNLGFDESWLQKPKPKSKAKPRLALPPPMPMPSVTPTPALPIEDSVSTGRAIDAVAFPPLVAAAPMPLASALVPVATPTTEAIPTVVPPQPGATTPTTARLQEIATITPTAATANAEAVVTAMLNEPTTTENEVGESTASRSDNVVKMLQLVAQKREAAVLRRQERAAAQEPADAVSSNDQTAAAPEPPLDDRECVICKSTLSNGAVQAMECMHVFHRECVQDYMRVGGQPFRYACPYKCFHNELHAAVLDAEDLETVDDGEDTRVAVADEALLHAADSIVAP